MCESEDLSVTIARHRNEIDKIREHFGDRLTDHYATDSCLLRWVTGWDGRMDEIFANMAKHLKYRKAWKLDDVKDPSYLDQFAEQVRDCIPGGILGIDRQGNVGLMDPIPKIDPKAIVRATRVSELIKRRFMDTEYLSQLIQQQEKRTGKRSGMFLIMDLEGLSAAHLYKPALQIYITIISMLQEQYPDLLAKILVIRGPAIVKVAYNLIYPFLAKKTREKVEFAGSNWQDRLFEFFDKDQLPVFWGGTRTGKYGKYGEVNMNSIPEKFLWKYQPADPRTSKLTSLSVSRGSKDDVHVYVRGKRTKLEWFLSMDAHDIIFAVFHLRPGKSEREVVVPPLKISCEFYPEFGDFECQEEGTYIFEFDNSYSSMRSKTVHYCITQHHQK